MVSGDGGTFKPPPPPGGAAGALNGAGVDDRLVAALRLWRICAPTRCPAASAEHRESSPARTVPAMMQARRRELSPEFVGCGPRTPSRSSMAACGSRIVPPPMVPTSIEGIETDICKLPSTLNGAEETPKSQHTAYIIRGGIMSTVAEAEAVFWSENWWW